MPVADTELLFLLNPDDSRHKAAMDRLRAGHMSVPDTAFLEFAVVLRSKGLQPAVIREIILSVADTLKGLGVGTASVLGPEVIAQAASIEEKHGLSFFDALIAASSLILDRVVLSDDAAYDRVEGLKRVPLTP